MKPVIIAEHPTTGLVITPSKNNPLWGTVRLTQQVVTRENGIRNESVRNAFYRGEIAGIISDGWNVKGKAVPGQIVKIESNAPMYQNADGTDQDPVRYPKLNKDGSANPKGDEVVLKNGAPYYMQFQYTEDTSAPAYRFIDSKVVVEAPVETEAIAK